ncbi:MAG TPA: hypothetical protein VIT44_05250 [Cyclobacteriaceae bacterium]
MIDSTEDPQCIQVIFEHEPGKVYDFSHVIEEWEFGPPEFDAEKDEDDWLAYTNDTGWHKQWYFDELVSVLPKRVVCDKCNNYFAVKIENPVLSDRFFGQLRGRNWIQSKKGNIPMVQGWFLHKTLMKKEVEFHFHP